MIKLSKEKLSLFKDYLFRNGWYKLESRSEWEESRWIAGDKTVIVYQRKQGYFTLPDGIATQLYKEFLNA